MTEGLKAVKGEASIASARSNYALCMQGHEHSAVKQDTVTVVMDAAVASSKEGIVQAV